MDLLLPDMIETVKETVKPYFSPLEGIDVKYRATSIYDQSVYAVVGEIIQALILHSSKAKSVSEAINEFLRLNQEVTGIAVYTEDGLPVFEEGKTDQIILPANLWLASYERLSAEYDTEDIKAVVETNNFIFMFHAIKSELYLSGIAQKVAPLQYVLVKMEQLSETLNQLL